jgi:hypothetical protein
MEARINTGFRTGLFTMVCAATLFSLVGCQTEEMAVSQENPACPLCGGATQAQARGELSCTRAVCSMCGKVATVDLVFLDRLDLHRGPLGYRLCLASCKALVTQCAACRQKGAS